MEHHRYFIYLCLYGDDRAGFAIEIGQKITGTGEMDFRDVVAGLYGVLLFFAIYTVYRVAVLLIRFAVGRVRTRHALSAEQAEKTE